VGTLDVHYLLHFWWWEFRLVEIEDWTALKYLFIILYTLLLYALTNLLFPDDIDDYSGYREYFISRHRWFFSILAVMFAVDLLDTVLKGRVYFASLGLTYKLGIAGYILCSVIAAITSNERLLGGFALVATIYQVAYMLTIFYRVR